MKFRYILIPFLTGAFLVSSSIFAVSIPNYYYNLSLATSLESTTLPEDTPFRILSFYFDSPRTLQNFDFLASFSPLPSLVFDSLVDYSFEREELIPSLATSWIVSLDSRHWTFFLRRNVFFHDGTPFNASAVKFSYDRIIDPSHPAYIDPGLYALDLQSFPLESVTIMNPFTVTFHFSEPYAPFLYNEAALLGIYSPRSFTGPNISFPIGTGLYQFTEASNNLSTYLLTRNTHHFRGIPPFSQILYHVFDDLGAYDDAVLNHEGDFGLIPLYDLLPEDDNYWEDSLGWAALELGWFNHSNPYLADSRVRSAINYAIDKVNLSLQFSQVPNSRNVLTSILFSTSLFHDESVPGYLYDPNLANALLDIAGYPRGSDGYRFALNLVSNEARSEKVYFIQNQLIEIGINPILSFPPVEDFYSGIAPFDIYIGGFGGMVDPSYVWNFLHSSGRLNLGGFNDTYMDLLISYAQSTPVEQEREYYYYLIQWLSQEKVPYLFLEERRICYLRASTISSLVEWNVNGEITFNFPVQTDPILSISNIPVSDSPLYCQLADLSIFPGSMKYDSSISIEYTSQFNHFFYSQTDMLAKFYRLTADEEKLYSLRFYYDLSDFNESSNIEPPSIYVWNSSLGLWNKLEVRSSNFDFRYIETSIDLSSEPQIFSIGFEVPPIPILDEVVRSFTFLFPYLILLGTVISLGAAVILINRIFLKNIKEEFLLQ